MKSIAILTLLFFAGTAAKADNIVSVSLNPFDFGHQISFTGQDLGDELIAATFTWDVTTGALSNIVLAVTGPFQPLPYSSTASRPGGISFLSFGLTDNAIYSLNYNLHGPIAGTHLDSTPGTHFADLNLWCACMSGDQDETPPGNTATITQLSTDSDTVSTPEPSSLLLLGVTSLLGFLVKVSR